MIRIDTSVQGVINLSEKSDVDTIRAEVDYTITKENGRYFFLGHLTPIDDYMTEIKMVLNPDQMELFSKSLIRLIKDKEVKAVVTKKKFMVNGWLSVESTGSKEDGKVVMTNFKMEDGAPKHLGGKYS